MQNAWLVQSKIAPPPSAAPLVPRRRRCVELLAPTAAQIVLLQGPAGFGKSTLLGELRRAFVEERGGIAAWVSLDETIADDVLFFAYLAMALRANGLSLPTLQDVPDDDLLGLPTAVVARLVETTLERSGTNVALFLDDLHALGTWHRDSGISRFLTRLPRGVRTFATTRGDVPRTLLHLKAAGRVEIVGADRLRMTTPEIAALLGRDAADPAVVEVERVTEGWPLAVQLFRVAPDAQPRNSAQSVAGALCSVVLAALAPAAREHLIAAAAFDRVRGDLLDAVLDSTAGGGFLEQVSRDTSLVSDIGGGWYRLHALLRDYLSEPLALLEPARRARLHALAADWFLARGLLQEAFQHAQLTGDPDCVADIGERAGGWRLAIGAGRRVLGTLMRIAALDPVRHPVLRLTHVYTLAQEGLVVDARAAFEQLRHATLGFTRGRHGQADPALAADAAVMEVVLRIYEDRALTPESVFALERQLGQGEGVDPRVASISGNLICYAYFDVGDYDRCVRYGEFALAKDVAAGSAYAEIYLFLYMGLAHFRLGDLPAAGDRYERAFELARARFGADSNQAAIATMLLAQSSLECGRVRDGAADLPGAFSASLSRDGWFDVYFSGLETRVRLALLADDLDEAHAVIAQAERAAAARGTPRLGALAKVLRAELLARSGRVAEAAAPLAAAAAEAGLDDAASPAARDRRLWEAFVLAHVRLDLAAGRSRAAAARVERLLPALAQSPRERLRAKLLRALALLQGGSLGVATRETRDALREADGGFHGSAAWELADSAATLLGTAGDATDTLSAAMHPLAAAVGRAFQRAVPAGAATALSPRELETLAWIAAGRSNKDVARRLGISESTVKTHRERIYRKLGIGSRADAVDAARRLGILIPTGS